MTDDQPLLHQTLGVDDLPAGSLRRVLVHGEPVCVANVEGDIYAVSDTCTHARIPLSNGSLCGRLVVCPWHGAMFDMKTGRAACGPAVDPVRVYRTRIDDGRIIIEPAEPSDGPDA